MGRSIAFVYGLFCYAVFFLTFLYLYGFLANLPQLPRTIDSGPAAPPLVALLINVGLIALFGLQHTVMARPAFKAKWTRIVPAPIERSTYVLVSSLLLILLFWLWRPMTGTVVWSAESVWGQYLGWGVLILGFFVVLLSTFIIDHFDLFGLKQVWRHLQQKAYAHPGFKVTYFYRFVRHPLYLGWLMTFWGTPRMTLGHLLFALGMSGYILIAIRYEERDLEHFLGEDYARYREKVPMLIPQPGKRHATVRSSGDDHTAAHSH